MSAVYWIAKGVLLQVGQCFYQLFWYRYAEDPVTDSKKFCKSCMKWIFVFGDGKYFCVYFINFCLFIYILTIINLINVFIYVYNLINSLHLVSFRSVGLGLVAWGCISKLFIYFTWSVSSVWFNLLNLISVRNLIT